MLSADNHDQIRMHISKLQKYIVIDLFAGPGGLGEGFSAFRDSSGTSPFKVGMSVEFEENAHNTLRLRSFFRQFEDGAPRDYYDYVRGKISLERLFELWPDQAEKASEEVLLKPRKLGPAEVGESADDEIAIIERLQELAVKHPGPKIVIGGPPCQAYSTVGRARNNGKKNYRAAEDERYFLYEEYSRVLAVCKPKVFVLENVVGMLSAQLDEKPIVSNVLESLRRPKLPGRKRNDPNCRYRVYSVVTGNEITELPAQGNECVVRMDEFGVPQARKRVILLGVLEEGDKNRHPSTLTRSTELERQECTVQKLIGGLPRLRSKLSRGNDSVDAWHRTIKSGGRLAARELKKKKLDSSIVATSVEKALKLKKTGTRFIKSTAGYSGPKHLAEWLTDPELQGFANHETRGHKPSDLARYLYYSSYATLNNGLSPHVYDLPDSLIPNHKNVKESVGDKENRKFSDRFKVQAANRPASTITSHIKKDGHYFIHYDPSQVRSLTVREAARLQTFPDNYFFEGKQGAQFQQVGNAVPPWLAHQIAKIVHDILS